MQKLDLALQVHGRTHKECEECYEGGFLAWFLSHLYDDIGSPKGVQAIEARQAGDPEWKKYY